MNKILTSILFIILVACMQTTPSQQGISPEDASAHSITTSDGQTIAYTTYLAAPNAPAVILLHMLNHDRTTWESYARMLQESGFNVIAIDFRGHGQSSGDWNAFNDADFNNMVRDVEAAKNVLAARGADTTSLSIIGASIGANIALKYAGQDPDVNTVVLLSPGKTYRSVSIENYQYDGPVMWVASEEDTPSMQALQLKQPHHYQVILQQAGHGTDMLPEIQNQITQWIIQQR